MVEQAMRPAYAMALGQTRLGGPLSPSKHP